MIHVSEEVLVGQVGPGIPLREALVADGEAVRVEEVAHHEVLVGDLIVTDHTQASSLPRGTPAMSLTMPNFRSRPAGSPLQGFSERYTNDLSR